MISLLLASLLISIQLTRENSHIALTHTTARPTNTTCKILTDTVNRVRYWGWAKSKKCGVQFLDKPKSIIHTKVIIVPKMDFWYISSLSSNFVSNTSPKSHNYIKTKHLQQYFNVSATNQCRKSALVSKLASPVLTSSFAGVCSINSFVKLWILISVLWSTCGTRVTFTVFFVCYLNIAVISILDF